MKVLELNVLAEPHYVEPYAGGAGIALSLLFQEYVESITINDADPRIRCFWEAVVAENDAFLDLLANIDVTVDEWRRQRAIYDKCNAKNVLQLGFAAFFLNRTSRSGIIFNAGPIGGYDQRGNYPIDARFNRSQLARRIQRIGTYGERIHVSGLDGLSLLKRINKKTSRAKHTFVYIDPPYYVKGSALYLNSFTHREHSQLADYLSTRKNFPWIMTYDNVEPIRVLYAGLCKQAFALNYSAAACREGNELLIYPESVRLPAKNTPLLLSTAS